MQSSKDTQQGWFRKACNIVIVEYDENAIFQMFVEVIEVMAAV